MPNGMRTFTPPRLVISICTDRLEDSTISTSETVLRKPTGTLYDRVAMEILLRPAYIR